MSLNFWKYTNRLTKISLVISILSIVISVVAILHNPADKQELIEQEIPQGIQDGGTCDLECLYLQQNPMEGQILFRPDEGLVFGGNSEPGWITVHNGEVYNLSLEIRNKQKDMNGLCFIYNNSGSIARLSATSGFNERWGLVNMPITLGFTSRCYELGNQTFMDITLEVGSTTGDSEVQIKQVRFDECINGSLVSYYPKYEDYKDYGGMKC